MNFLAPKVQGYNGAENDKSQFQSSILLSEVFRYLEFECCDLQFR